MESLALTAGVFWETKPMKNPTHRLLTLICHACGRVVCSGTESISMSLSKAPSPQPDANQQESSP